MTSEEVDKYPLRVCWPATPGGINGCRTVVMPAADGKFGLWLPDLAGLTPLPNEKAIK